ncbi:Gfo/Idh/MocA family protein [Actinophytocola sp. KF-1]
MGGCRIGFVGAGGVADRHARTLAGFQDVSLVAVTDTDGSRAGEFAARHGMTAVGDVRGVLACGVDAVYVCVPPFAHGAVEEELVAARVPMFVEKPVGVDLATPERIAASVAEAGLLTAVGHHWRYSTAVERARQALRDRPARLAIGAWLDKVPPVGWWTRRASSGGQVVEQAIHVLDLARLLLGEVREVHAMADGVPPAVADADVDGATVVALRFASGAVGTLAATCLLGWKHRAGLEVYADGLAISVAEALVEFRDRDGNDVRQVDPDAAKTAADRAFVHAVLGRDDGAGIRTSYADALRTHRLACAIAWSAVRGEPVPVEEVVDAGR